MHHWANAPQPVRIQAAQLLQSLADLFGPDLIGLYLHGSLAMGCFNPARSDLPPADRDLAAHLTILHHRGVVLQGPPIAALFPPVPPRDYLAAIWGDIGSVDLELEPVYGVLCLCRVLAYAADDQVTSKEEGGQWALAGAGLSPEHRAVVVHALALYRGAELEPRFSKEDRRSFGLCLHQRIARLIN